MQCDILLLGAESLHPSKILLLKLVTLREGIHRGGLWEIIQVRGGHDGRSRSDGVSALIITFEGETPESTCSLPHGHRKEAV